MTLVRGGWHVMIAALVMGVLTSAAPSIYGQDSAHIQLKDVERSSLNAAYQVQVHALNFRSEPTLNTPPLSVVQRGDFLLETGRTFNQDEGIEWVKVIRGDGLEGWVSGRHIQPVKDALVTVEDAAAFLANLTPATAALSVGAMDDLRAGFVFVSPVGDAGWTFSHDNGRQALEKMPFVSETSYIESVPEEPKLVSDAIEQLVAEGSNLIFATSYGYMDPTIEAAKRHPDVVFMHSSGFKTQPNAGTYFGRIYEARYLSGIVAGAMTETNLIGYIAAFPIPEVIRGINAFTLGAQSVNPEVRVEIEWTKTWYGPGIERSKAELLLDREADVLAIHQDSPAAIQAAAQRGKFAIGYHSDMSPFGPETVLTSAVWDWGVIYKQIALELREGVWDPEQLWWGLEKGVVGLAPVSDKVPADVRALVEQRETEIADQRLRIFEGPIRDVQGDIRVPSGALLSDADLLTMDYYVLGVEGGIAPAVSLASDEGEAN